MTTYFARIWAQHETISLSQHQYAVQAAKCTYPDLSSLPWARDGNHASAPARLAFARKEASWRTMLVSQPPIRWMDWYHEWECSDRRSEQASSDLPVRQGDAHYYSNAQPITMGSLWDFMEARLIRGCTVQVTFFPNGGPAAEDSSAGDYEKVWHVRARAEIYGFSTSFPRVRVHSQQMWPNEGPAMYQKFDVPGGVWNIYDQLPFTPGTVSETLKYETLDGDGSFWLKADCKRDGAEANWRWSRSDASTACAACLGEYPAVIASMRGGFGKEKDYDDAFSKAANSCGHSAA